MIKVKRIATVNELDSLWGKIKPLLARSAEKGYTALYQEDLKSLYPEEIKVLFADRKCDIFYTYDDKNNKLLMVYVVQPVSTPKGLIYVLLATAGEKLNECYPCIEQIFTWMRLNGAVAVETMASDGISRMLDKHGWSVVCHQIRKEL